LIFKHFYCRRKAINESQDKSKTNKTPEEVVAGLLKTSNNKEEFKEFVARYNAQMREET
jgi:hypothetical protein